MKSVESRGKKEFDHIRRRFQGLVDDTKHTFGVAFTKIVTSEQIAPYRIDVYEHADALGYPAVVNGQCQRDAYPVSFPQVMGHELAHHYPQAVGLPMSSEEYAMQAENVYLAFAGKQTRCAY